MDALNQRKLNYLVQSNAVNYICAFRNSNHIEILRNSTY